MVLDEATAVAQNPVRTRRGPIEQGGCLIQRKSDGKYLIISSTRHTGQFVIPKGRAGDKVKTLIDAAKKKALVEAGCEVKIKSQIGVFDDVEANARITFWKAELVHEYNVWPQAHRQRLWLTLKEALALNLRVCVRNVIELTRREERNQLASAARGEAQDFGSSS